MLRSGGGDDTAFERFWCNPGSAVWNNDGDTVHLYDAAGVLIATHCPSRHVRGPDRTVSR